MADALSKSAHTSQSTNSVWATLTNRKITAYTCGLIITGALPVAGLFISGSEAQAADFSHAQHVFVPPTSIPRHFDSEALNYGNATGDSPDLYPSSGSPSVNGSSIKTTTQNGKSFNKTLYDSRSPQSHASAAVGSGANTDASPAMNAFVNQARTKAQALVKQGKLAAAEDMLQTDLKAVPKSQGLQTELANVRVARARFAMKAGDNATASQHAEAALLVQPNNAAAKQILAQTEGQADATTNSITSHLTKAKISTAQGNFTDANKEIQSALKIKDTADVHTAMGDLAFKQGNDELARTQYAKALQLDPESGNALRQNGLFKLHENDVVGANKDLSRALIINTKDKESASALQKIWQGQISKNPQSSNAHLGLARAYQLSDELSLAQVEYKEVVRLDPQHPSIPAARRSFKQALAKQESIKCLQAAKTLEDAGALTEAHQKALEAVNICPTCVSARVYQGIISEKLKLYTEAHEAYMTALRYDPKNTIAARHLRALQGNVNLAEASSAPTASAPNVPQGMYVFRGWQYGHPLATNNTAAAGATYNGAAQGATGATDASGMQSNNYAGAQNASYGSATNGVNSSPLAALSAGPALALPGGPTTAQLADPTAPMPLQGTPPVTASTTAHVNAFSSFLSSIRDLQVNQKQQSMQAESAMSSVLNPGGYSGSSSGYGGASSSALSPGSITGSGTSSAGSIGLGGAPASLGSLGDPSMPPINTPSSSSISNILAQAKAAISSAGGTSTAASTSAAQTGSATTAVASTVSQSATAAPAAQAGTTAGDPGQSISGAAWDAAPAWIKKKFPNMTQADFTALAGKYKGNIKSRLQALAAQQKAASQGTGTAPTADDALAGLLPAGMTVSQLSSALASAAPAAASGASSVLANLMPPGAIKSAADEQSEQELFARAGQDAPTTLPPEVVPAEALVQTTVVLKTKTADAPAASASSAALVSPAGVIGPGTESFGNTSIAQSQAGSGQPVAATDISTGLAAQTQALASVPPLSSLRPAISSGNSLATPSGSSSTSSITRSDLTADASRDDSNNDNSNASVVLELQGYNPTATGIKLKVVLKNSRTKALPLPDSARAVIHMPGQPDKEARITFAAKEVIAGGIVQGTIKVPGHDLNPSADLVLPNFLPTAFSDRDVHLTVPISALMK